MAKKEETAIAAPTTDPYGLQTRPDFLKREGKPVRGTEEIEAADMRLPRLSLTQSQTPERTRGNVNFIEGLQEGHFFNSLTKQNYGEVIQFIPLFFYKSRIMFKDITQGGGIICQAPNGRNCQLNNGGPCLHQDWGADGTPPACNEFYNYPALLIPNLELIVLSFKRTAIAAAKDLNTYIRLKQSDAFSGIYQLMSAPDKNAAQQQYFVPLVSVVGWVNNEQFAFAEKAYESLKPKVDAGQQIVDMTGLETDVRPDTAGESGDQF